jgi:hypothetical protein
MNIFKKIQKAFKHFKKVSTEFNLNTINKMLEKFKS